MFIQFFHKELTAIKALQQQLINVYEGYIEKDYFLDEKVEALIQAIIDHYKAKNEEQHITWGQSLLAELKTAKRGIHPFTLERVTIRRNDLCMTTCYKIIQNTNDKLSAENSRITSKLTDAFSLLKQIVLTAMQMNAITLVELKKANSQKNKEKIWSKILAIEGMQQHTRNLIVTVSQPDIIILLEELRESF